MKSMIGRAALCASVLASSCAARPASPARRSYSAEDAALLGAPATLSNHDGRDADGGASERTEGNRADAALRDR